MNSVYQVLVVDDEYLAREAITLRLQNNPDFQLCGEADNGNDAILLCSSLKPDVVFLDIEMPELNGLAAAKLIVENSDAFIVFVSAYSHYALEAFRVNAIDYILKPIDDSLFKQMLDRIKGRLLDKHQLRRSVLNALNELQVSNVVPNSNYLKRIAVKMNDISAIIDVADIESIVSVKDYLCIKAKDTVYIHRCTMKQIVGFLNPSDFMRIHRSHIVNLNFVIGIENEVKSRVIMTLSGDRHPVSRRYFDKVKIFFNQIKPLNKSFKLSGKT